MGKLEKNVLKKVVNASEFIISFKFKYLIEFYFLNVSFMFLGVFHSLLSWLFLGRGLTSNMGFLPQKNDKHTFKRQILAWLGNVTLMTLMFTMPLRNVYPTIMHSLIFMMFFRGFIIAVRYSFASTFRVMQLKRKQKEFKYVIQDLFLYAWDQPDPEAVDREI